jgi:hypothetical protein
VFNLAFVDLSRGNVFNWITHKPSNSIPVMICNQPTERIGGSILEIGVFVLVSLGMTG